MICGSVSGYGNSSEKWIPAKCKQMDKRGETAQCPRQQQLNPKDARVILANEKISRPSIDIFETAIATTANVAGYMQLHFDQ